MLNIESAKVKLTGFYLLIIMAICVFFSVALYHLSIQEIQRSYHRQTQIIGATPQLRPLLNDPEFTDVRQDDLIDAKRQIMLKLIAVNMLIAFFAGLLSYYLAGKSLKPIEESHEAQSRFTADASHELRTPITAMQTEIEVALKDPKLSISSAKELLKSNLEELAKLTSLTTSLLQLSRLEGDKVDLEEVQLAEVSAKLKTRMQSLAKAKAITLNFSDTALTVQSNNDSLLELLTIIVDNAIKYSPDKTAVTIDYRDTGKQCWIRISDQGSGINKNDLPKIFDRFYRADASRSKNTVEGYGLGLAIAKSIADSIGASITATSTKKGSTFTITLPKS